MKNPFEIRDREYWILLTVTTIIFVTLSFVASRALTPMSESELSQINGREGMDLSFDLRANYDSSNSQICCGGGIWIGGGTGTSPPLHQTGNAGFLVFNEIYGHVLWDKLVIDATTINGQGMIRLNMGPADSVSGTLTVDELGVTDSATSTPDNLAGAVTMNGTFNMGGSLKAWAH